MCLNGFLASDIDGRIEIALRTALACLTRYPCPQRLAQSLRYAVFPGGARIRPRLCLAVAWACGDRGKQLSTAAATAIELLHCASLVHDDLPCFDDALIRRRRPALHRVFGEALAVLTGDGLIVAACDLLARVEAADAQTRIDIQSQLLAAVGAPFGLVAGQAWEEEDSVNMDLYHTCKTRGLFEAATVCGALAAGASSEEWRDLGKTFGEAYQVADDIVDVAGSEGCNGKSVLRDQALGRPNIALQRGLEPAVQTLGCLLRKAGKQVPDCPGNEELRRWLSDTSMQLLAKADADSTSDGIARRLAMT